MRKEFLENMFICNTILRWKFYHIGSRFSKPAETRCAPIEGESLAIAEGLNKARYFVLGCKDLIVATDHKPLLQIFNDRSLDNIDNVCVYKFKEKTLPYRFRMVYIPGRKHYTPDALSRYPTVSGIFNSSRKEPSLSISHLLAGIRSSEPDQEHTVDTELTVAAMNAFSTANIKCVTWNDV